MASTEDGFHSSETQSSPLGLDLPYHLVHPPRRGGTPLKYELVPEQLVAVRTSIGSNALSSGRLNDKPADHPRHDEGEASYRQPDDGADDRHLGTAHTLGISLGGHVLDAREPEHDQGYAAGQGGNQESDVVENCR